MIIMHYIYTNHVSLYSWLNWIGNCCNKETEQVLWGVFLAAELRAEIYPKEICSVCSCWPHL